MKLKPTFDFRRISECGMGSFALVHRETELIPFLILGDQNGDAFRGFQLKKAANQSELVGFDWLEPNERCGCALGTLEIRFDPMKLATIAGSQLYCGSLVFLDQRVGLALSSNTGRTTTAVDCSTGETFAIPHRGMTVASYSIYLREDAKDSPIELLAIECGPPA